MKVHTNFMLFLIIFRIQMYTAGSVYEVGLKDLSQFTIKDQDPENCFVRGVSPRKINAHIFF